MTGNRTALIIDDDADIREMLSRMLEQGGFDVDVLSDGIDAVDLKKWYDVILLDLKMPVFDGQRLTDYWHLTNPDILRRVIVLSGYSRMKMAHEPPTFARLEKPFHYQALMTIVHRCVAQSQTLDSQEKSNV